MNENPLVAVVDDDQAIRSGLSSLLRSAGFAVELHESAEGFIDRPPRAAPACLLTDIQLPGISGLDLQDRVRSSDPALPVIVLTAFPSPAVEERVRAGGAICFLSKPFDADRLLECVRRAIAR